MAYVPLQLDPSIPAAVAAIIRKTIEGFYFRDVHAMLRLPLPDHGIEAGQNFAAAQVLMCVISGASVLLYDNTLEPGKSFKALIENCFPWDEEPGPKRPQKASAGILYDVFRNPLTHNVGLSMDRRHGVYFPVKKTYKVVLKRLMPHGSNRGHSEDWLEQLERAQKRPNMGATLLVEAGRRVLHVEGLYWGTRRMIEKLSRDSARMQRVQRLIAPYLSTVSTPRRASKLTRADGAGLRLSKMYP